MRDEDIPDINNPKTITAVLEGDKLMKEVLNGGYNVHPVPPPNSPGTRAFVSLIEASQQPNQLSTIC